MRVLCVAEKPSVAKQIASLLASDSFRTVIFNQRSGFDKFCKIFEFSIKLSDSALDICLTSVRGHVTTLDFPKIYHNWKGFDPLVLFNANIELTIAEDMNGIVKNLETQAVKCTMLYILTDCDREGEYIGTEIRSICLKANNRMEVRRIHFSSLTKNELFRAMCNPKYINENEAKAVFVRMKLDLVSGAVFTRFLTLKLRKEYEVLKDSLVSYGSCQFPTLGFIVKQYLKVVEFSPQKFYFLKLILKFEDENYISFNWKRHRCFDFSITIAILASISYLEAKCHISKISIKNVSKWRPLPLRTVELQKIANRFLKFSSDKTMKIAEKLYNNGYISYPRTETDIFEENFDHRSLIAMQSINEQWGSFATILAESNKAAFFPRKGKFNDKAHPPIHPTKPNDTLKGDELKLYELITRTYLAGLSKDAVGQEITYEIKISTEEFIKTFLRVKEKNFLEVYIYEKWHNDCCDNDEFHRLCFLVEGSLIDNFHVLMDESYTTSPLLLNETELISLMDKNGIGTDATIHEHIAKIQDRTYVLKDYDGRFCPTYLGLGLVKFFDLLNLEYSLTCHQLRAEMEKDFSDVAKGLLESEFVIKKFLELFKRIFITSSSNTLLLVSEFKNLVKNSTDILNPILFPKPSVQSHVDHTNPNLLNNNGIHKKCKCGLIPVINTSRKKTNLGKSYLKCSKVYKPCNFFEWVDNTDNLNQQISNSLQKKNRAFHARRKFKALSKIKKESNIKSIK